MAVECKKLATMREVRIGNIKCGPSLVWFSGWRVGRSTGESRVQFLVKGRCRLTITKKYKR